jgi:hypothetical protein
MAANNQVWVFKGMRSELMWSLALALGFGLVQGTWGLLLDAGWGGVLLAVSGA